MLLFLNKNKNIFLKFMSYSLIFLSGTNDSKEDDNPLIESILF